MAEVTLEKLVSLCKRRGFIFQSSEIYGGLNGAYDYGPLGVELKNNIRDFWWKEMTRLHDDIVGLDASILMHPRVWEASGHIENFSDPMVDCKHCKARHRADQVDLEGACPNCGTRDSFTEPREFNLMFSTHIGATTTDDSSKIYLRPETAQGIYVDFKNVVSSSRVRVPFGVAQVGKAFRNEITTRHFIFRSVEFEQLEMQWFCAPGTDDQWYEYWKEQRLAFYHKMGIRPTHLRWVQHGEDELAFYAKVAYDIQYLFPMGWQELEGVHNRTDYDLTQHQEFSGKDMTYLDSGTNERYIPYVVETSAGLTRAVLATLSDAYEEETLEGGDVRTVMHFHPEIAPITVAVLPLVRKDGIAEFAKEVQGELREEFSTFFDVSGAIGRRYRRMDEVGTPYCVTVDYQSLEDKTVTLRYRDSMEQERVAIADLPEKIRAANKAYKRVGIEA